MDIRAQNWNWTIPLHPIGTYINVNHLFFKFSMINNSLQATVFIFSGFYETESIVDIEYGHYVKIWDQFFNKLSTPQLGGISEKYTTAPILIWTPLPFWNVINKVHHC